MKRSTTVPKRNPLLPSIHEVEIVPVLKAKGKWDGQVKARKSPNTLFKNLKVSKLYLKTHWLSKPSTSQAKRSRHATPLHSHKPKSASNSISTSIKHRRYQSVDSNETQNSKLNATGATNIGNNSSTNGIQDLYHPEKFREFYWTPNFKKCGFVERGDRSDLVGKWRKTIGRQLEFHPPSVKVVEPTLMPEMAGEVVNKYFPVY